MPRQRPWLLRLLNSERVTEKDRWRIRIFLRFLSILFYISSALLILVLVKNWTIDLGFKERQQLAKKNLLEEEKRRLKIRLARARDPLRLEKIAREKLGMTQPRPSQVKLIQIREKAEEINEQYVMKSN